MAQYEMSLSDQWLVVRRRWRVVVLSTVVGALLCVWFGARAEPVYQATAAVQYEQSTLLAGSVVPVMWAGGHLSIDTQAALIKSHAILTEVARRLGKLPINVEVAQARESPVFSSVLDEVGRPIKATRISGTSIIEIAATSPTPRQARELANTFAEAYRDNNRSLRNARVRESRKFIETQLKEVEERVKRAQQEAREFRMSRHVIARGDEGAGLSAMFTNARAELEKIQQQRADLEQAQKEALRGAETPWPARALVDGASPTFQRLHALEVELLIERNNLRLEFTDEHPRAKALAERIRTVRTAIQSELSAQLQRLTRRESALERRMAELLQRSDEVESGLQARQRNAKLDEELLVLLKTRHQEALIKEAEVVEDVTIVRPAIEPTGPVGTRSVNTLLLGALLGSVLGVVLTFVLETLDTSIGTIEDIEGYLKIPVVGIVPHIHAREMAERVVAQRPWLAEADPLVLQNQLLLVTLFDPSSPVAEAYRALRTNVRFATREQSGKILLVTSSTLQEGKTTTVANLALALAKNGQRVLIVGANLRRPSVHRFFGIADQRGLLDVLAGNAPWRDCVASAAETPREHFEPNDLRAPSGLENLSLMPTGGIPANPAELLSTPAMARFLEEVRSEYDIVLLDTPPVLPVTDATILAAKVDGVILVYQAGKVGRLVVKRAKAHLDAAQAKLWGVVLNDVRPEGARAVYAHHYMHYYGDSPPAVAKAPAEPLQQNGTQAGVAASGTPLGRLVPKYENFWLGIALLTGLLGLLAGLIAWRIGWLSDLQRLAGGP